ncbi:MAG: carbamoyltransferase HypF [Planctomycetaceae bacterium]|nr:carbamoyltransferase HypF [Planctomycetaceae bacterium]
MTERLRIRVSGTVQGVGFRPFVHRLASGLRLGGFVRNQAGDVLIEAEGASDLLEHFLHELVSRPPLLARIDRVLSERLPLGEDGVESRRSFRIEASQSDSAGSVCISPDVATCPACLAEMRNPADRRFGYPFLNCTNCGPRLTIVKAAPYDRARTTMAGFPLCPACRGEYSDAADRRFHAQPVACPRCGPQLELLGQNGEPIACGNPVAKLAEGLCAGRIGAVKGLGGYHLVCDARNELAVRELRRRKQRDEKPFALMLRDVAAVRVFCDVEPREAELLESWRSPIVLLRRKAEPASREEMSSAIANAVAPGQQLLGMMLPNTPLHHLLVDAVEGIPLVMTSGNQSDEPMAVTEAAALDQLRGIADLFLVHNRPIHVRCDDSVTRVVAGAELPVRRSRGYAPQPVRLPASCPVPQLAVGGQLKSTFALGQGNQAILSHHLGDLDHYQAFRAFEKDVALYLQLFDHRPECIAHDLHPDYASTRFARRLAGESSFDHRLRGIPLVPVQHHHAHMAACMVENGLTEPVIGVTFDGTGYGTDGAVWGGEFLTGDPAAFRRAAHLRYVGLPGGDQAVKEPWRMAVAHLIDAGCRSDALQPDLLQPRISPLALRTVESMLRRRFNSPPTSSMGRLFDAVASLAGVRDRVSYEGQAAMELEWLATGLEPQPGYPWEVQALPDQPLVIDTRPLIRAVVEDVRQGTDCRLIAGRFHATVVDLIAGVCGRIRQESGLNSVVLSGGVFLNAVLTEEATARLADEGFEVYRHRLVPPNDGGLSLGQLAVAAAVLKTGREYGTSEESSGAEQGQCSRNRPRGGSGRAGETS